MAKKSYFKEVQDYKKTHPRSSHQAACTAISKERKKLSGVKSKPAKKKAAKAAPVKKITVVKAVSTGTVGYYTSGAKKALALKLGSLEAQRFMAKKKSDKNRYTRDIRDIKTQLRKFL